MSALSDQPLIVHVRYFDGRTARVHCALLSFRGDRAVLSQDGGQVLAEFDRASLVAIEDEHAPVATTLTSRDQPGTRIVFDSADQARTVLWLLAPSSRSDRGIAATWPALAMWSIAALFVVAAIYVIFPKLIGPITAMIPRTLEKRIGDGLMIEFAKRWPMCDARAGRAALDEIVKRLAPSERGYGEFQVHVLSSPLVNAFAAPGNHIAVFSGLIERSRSPEEVAGVIAHEIGHHIKRHPMRGVVESVGASALMSAIFGGMTSEAVSAWGASLYSLKFGREAEREADAIAADLLRVAGIGTDGLIRFFERAVAQSEGAQEGVFAYLTTHPSPGERIEEVRRSASPMARQALSPESWTSLRAICGDADSENGSDETR